MDVRFPVNSGNVPPPSLSTNLLPQQLNAQNPLQGNNGFRRKPKQSVKKTAKLDLERILGLTSISSSILSAAEDLIAYAAGAVVVLYSQKKNKQIAFLYPPPSAQSTSGVIDYNNASSATDFQNQVTITALGNGNQKKNEILTSAQTNFPSGKKATPVSNRAKPVSCLTFSPDGQYLAVGEMGHQPRIFIWDVKEKKLLRELRSHKFGVLALSFSPNMRHLVSVGFQHDGYLYVWDWRKGAKIAGNKVTSRINAISFSKDGSYFVTAGLRHVRFWYLNGGGKLTKREGFHSQETRVLDGRSGLLGVLRDANFVDVACDKSKSTGYTYFVTDSGILCSFKAERVLDKWLDLQVKYAYSIAVTQQYVICSCSEGIVRLFEPVTLNYLGILPKPHPLGVDVTAFTSPSMVRHLKETPSYPDSVAMIHEADSNRLILVYSDRSLYVWDIHDIAKVGKARSFIYHSDCVWGVEPCPRIKFEDNAIPLNSFATFSADGTIRIWNVDNPMDVPISSSKTASEEQLNTGLISPSSSTTVSAHRRNIYSRELVKMVYVDPEAAEFSKIRGDIDVNDSQYSDYGIRSVRISSDGSIVASGDRSGNLRVHDLLTWDLISFQEAHDSEILSIDLIKSNKSESPSLIATASRDRMIHVFDIKASYQLIQSLDDHSSSITAVRFTKDGNKLISCGADKGVVFRQLTQPTALNRPFATYHNYSGRSTVFDMAIDVNDRHIATVTGERRLFVFNIDSGKSFRTCKPETADELGKSVENSGGSLINVDLDPFSGTYAVTSGSDRCIRLFDLVNNICIDKVCAHAELITSVKFVQTNIEEYGLRIISTCSDGTVFIWRVPPEIVFKMRVRAGERNIKSKQFQKVTGGVHDRGVCSQNGYLSNGRQQFQKPLTMEDVRPLVSMSKFVRRRDSRTFSTISAAEQKFEKLHDKLAIQQGRQSRRNLQSDSNSSNSAVEQLGVERSSKANCAQRVSGSRSFRDDTGNAYSASHNEITDNIKRLYNGLPTSGNTISRQPAQLGRPKNPMLRRAKSRDVLQDDSKSTDGALTGLAFQKSAALTPSNGDAQRTTCSATRGVSPLISSIEHLSDGDTAKQKKQPCEVEEHDGEDFNSDDESKRDTLEPYLEEENDIIFTPDEEIVNNSFNITVNITEDGELTGRSTPDTDNEAPSKSEEEEDELSSEDNIDEAINRDIISAEAPRITISRSSSMVKNLGRHSFHFQRSAGRHFSSVDGFDTAIRNNDTISIVQNDAVTSDSAIERPCKTAKKVHKRQSLTARFLSSLNLSKNNVNRVQPSPKEALGCSQQFSSPQQVEQHTLDDSIIATNYSVPAEKLVIDVAPVAETHTHQGTSVKERKTVAESNSELDTTKLNNVLTELDRITATINNVLETYLDYRNSSNKQVLDIERKLSCINSKINQVVPSDDSLNGSGTSAILEKYSSLLVAMIEDRVKK